MSDTKKKMARPPRSTRERAQAAFISQGDPVPEPKKEVQPLNVKIEKGLHKEFRKQALEEERTMTDIVEELIAGYLKDKNQA